MMDRSRVISRGVFGQDVFASGGAVGQHLRAVDAAFPARRLVRVQVRRRKLPVVRVVVAVVAVVHHVLGVLFVALRLGLAIGNQAHFQIGKVTLFLK